MNVFSVFMEMKNLLEPLLCHWSLKVSVSWRRVERPLSQISMSEGRHTKWQGHSRTIRLNCCQLLPTTLFLSDEYLKLATWIWNKVWDSCKCKCVTQKRQRWPGSVARSGPCGKLPRLLASRLLYSHWPGRNVEKKDLFFTVIFEMWVRSRKVSRDMIHHPNTREEHTLEALYFHIFSPTIKMRST